MATTRKRTVKFKDGSTGSYTPQARPTMTMFTCDRGTECVAGTEGGNGVIIPANLNTSEYALSNTCAACLMADRTKADKKELQRLKKEQKENEAAIVANLERVMSFAPDIIPLETRYFDYIGEMLKIEVYNTKGVNYPCVKVTNSKGEILIQSLHDEYKTKETRELFIFLRDQKEIPLTTIS